MIKKQFALAAFEVDVKNRIVFAEFTRNVKIDLAAAQEIVQNRMDVTESKPYYLIVEFSNIREVTSEAKEFLLRPDRGLHQVLGAAFIANNPVSALIANIFIKSSKKFPSRYFSSKTDAVAWILQLEQPFLKKL